jgi:hypothetical protein
MQIQSNLFSIHPLSSYKAAEEVEWQFVSEPFAGFESWQKFSTFEL